MENVFRAFAAFGKSGGDDKHITLSNSDKWMKQAGVIDGKTITTTDTAICFNKFKSKALDYNTYISFIKALAKEKNIDADVIIKKLAMCVLPSIAGTTAALKDAVVKRMTDTSKYTGAHKQRFDEEGKGRGKEGRSDDQEATGYVQGYKEHNKYDETHKK